MKKLLLALVLMCASVGVFADELFDAFVEGMKTTEGVRVRPDKPHRMVFVDIRIPDADSLTDEQFAELKNEMLRGARSDRSAASVVRELNVTIVYNIITQTGNIYSVVITPADL